MNDSCSRMLL